MTARRDRVGLGDAAIAHLDALYNHARHLTGSDADADELVQETYARALARADSFVGGNLKAWLFNILRNTFVDGYRRRQHAAHTGPADGDLGEGAATEPRCSTTRSSGGCGGWSARTSKRRSRASRPRRARIILLEVEGFTEPEIAEVLDCPVGTVKSRLSRARALLRERLKDYARSSHGE